MGILFSSPFVAYLNSPSNTSSITKMVNTRAKFKKTQNTLKTCFSQASTSDTDHHPTPSGALIGSNDDLLTEILLRLPVTSILRFKSVSKHWRWLLSHQRFTLPYDNLMFTPGIFIRNTYIPFDAKNQSTPPFRSLDFYPDLSGIRIVQSCNGLLLCCSDRGNERSRKYYVFNPTTKQFAIIPSVPGGQDVRKTICFMGLAFHQKTCIHYKVICIHRTRINHNDGLFHIQIYSSSTGKWKITNNHFYAPYHTVFRNGVYFNESIHWAPSYVNPSYFNLNKEKLENLLLPSPLPTRVSSLGGYGDGYLPIYFGESRGHLHLVDIASDDNRLHIIVYEMLEDHSGWFVKYKVEFDDLPVDFSNMIQTHNCSEFEIIDVIRGKEEEEEDVFMVLKVSRKIIRYNVVDKSSEWMFDLTDVYYGRIRYSEVHRYMQSLTLF